MNLPEVILVGVDGSEESYAAVRYAAAEAGRRGATLHIAHVLLLAEGPDHAGGARGISDSQRELRDRGEMILEEARAQAQGDLTADQLSTDLLSGRRVEALLRATAGASMVVLGVHRRPALERIATSSVAGGVAAHSPVPVVAVPPGWDTIDPGAPVVAALQDLGEAGGLVQRAFEVADERHTDLVLLHAWEQPAYGHMFAAEIDPRAWEAPARERMEEIVKGIERPASETGARIEVRIEVRRGQPAQILVDASREASLMLISRRAHGFPFGHLGGTGRALLRECHGPVMVMPPMAQRVSAEDKSAVPG